MDSNMGTVEHMGTGGIEEGIGDSFEEGIEEIGDIEDKVIELIEVRGVGLEVRVCQGTV